MPDTPAPTYTVFDGHTRLAAGELAQIALAVKAAIDRSSGGPVLIFDDQTGRSIDIDIRGSDADVLARLDVVAPAIASGTVGRGRGRPRLGVVGREVTLLPRHWAWLATQPGGASVALRQLVEEARRSHAARDRRRLAQERAYHFMAAIGGDLPGFEEATRALFADARDRFVACLAAWPADVQAHAIELAFAPTLSP